MGRLLARRPCGNPRLRDKVRRPARHTRGAAVGQAAAPGPGAYAVLVGLRRDDPDEEKIATILAMREAADAPRTAQFLERTFFVT